MQLISALVFVTYIDQSGYFVNQKFQASSIFLWLYSQVWVRPGRKPGRQVFWRHGLLYFTLSSQPTGLLSEEQCKARDVRRKAKTRTTPRKSDSMEGSPMSVKSLEIEDSKESVKLKASVRPETIVEAEPISKVSEDTKILIEKCVFLQDKYEFPDEQIIQSVNVSICWNTVKYFLFHI